MINNLSVFDGFDIVGDIHGCARALRLLLEQLGYQETAQGYVYHQPEKPRQVIFLGDLIDRGSEIKECLNIVKTMWDHGNAQVILGNHELNAIAWHTPFQQGFVRQHDERAYQQLKQTLEQFSGQPELLASYVDWFRRLPLFLEFEHFRVVHACWDQALIDIYQGLYGRTPFSDDVLLDSAAGNSFAQCFLERLTQGINLPLPRQAYMLNRQGFKRYRFRAKFWCQQAKTYQDLVFQPDALPPELAQLPLSEKDRLNTFLYNQQEKPLFVGHYWLQGAPDLISPNIACLDYSAVNRGRLVAYRMQHDARSLSKDHFVCIDCREL